MGYYVSMVRKHLSKTISICTKVIAPYCVNIIKSVADVPALSVSTDAGNHGAEKMFPVFIQYFTVKEGIYMKLIDLCTLPNEKAQIIYSLLVETLERYILFGKCRAFSADN